MSATKKISNTLLFGLPAALVMILFVLGTWRSGPNVFLSWTAYIGTLIAIALAVIAAVMEKRANGGQLGFRAALKVSFGVLVLAIIGQYFFTWLLLNVIDPNFRQQLLPVLLDNMQRTYRRFGVPEDQIRQSLDAEKGQSFMLSGTILGMCRLMIVQFLVALIIAAAVKSKKGPTPKPGV